jgi:uncharacterized protein YjdB
VLSDGDKNGVACAYGARSGFTPVCGWYGAAYSGHVQNIGWTPRVLDGDTVGTMGQGLRLEAMKIWVGTNNQNSICYRTHVQNVGWQDIHCNGDLAGTEGQSLAIEAIKIWLPNAPTGCMVQSRAHVQDIGWQVWKTNGASEPSDSSNNYSGTTGQSKRIEALQIKVIGCN